MKINSRKTLIVLAATLFLPVATISAQDTAANKAAESPPPLASPRDTATGRVGSAVVSIDYGRPSKRDRPIFGGLVPYDKVWRTGANSATTLTIDKPIYIGKEEIPLGVYTLYTIPGKESWTLIVNKQTGQWGTVYDQKQDLVRIPMTVTTLDATVEQFEIDVKNNELSFMWDTVKASVKVSEKEPGEVVGSVENDDSQALLIGPVASAQRAGMSRQSAINPSLRRASGLAPAAFVAPRMGQSVALMIVGGAALITGLVIGDDVGTLIAVGGAGIGLYGLYNYLK